MSSPKPKRPGAKHHDSFFRKLHKRHDERHHPGENRHGHDVERPLLQEEHPDSASEAETQSVGHAPRRESRHGETTAITDRSVQERVISTVRNLSVSSKSSASAIAAGIIKISTTIRNTVTGTGGAMKNNPKRSLGIACCVLLLLALGEAVDIFMHHPLSEGGTHLCLSPACVNAASSILNNLHPSFQQLDPCNDFEKYVCDGFRMNHELREAQDSMFTGSLMENNLYTTLRHILQQEESAIKGEDKVIFKKIKDHYIACTDIQKLKEYGSQPLKSVVDEVRILFTMDKTALRRSSAYQILSSPATIAFNSLSVPLIHMTKLGIDALVAIKVGADDKNPGIQKISISPAKPIGLPAEKYYQNKQIIADYAKAIETSMGHFYDLHSNDTTMLNRNGHRSSITDLTRGVIQLESKLADILPSDMELSNPSNHVELTMEEFENLFPQLSLEMLTHELGPPETNSSSVLVQSTKYFGALAKLTAATPRDILQAFLVWKTIQAYAGMVEHEVLDSWRKFLNSLSGQEPNAKDERWRTCVASVNDDFGWILSKFYVDRKFSQEARNIAAHIVTDVATAFSKIVAESGWMAENDKAKALLKLEHMNNRIGFPAHHPNIRDAAALENFYNRVVISNNTYLENKLQSAKDNVFRQWLKLGQRIDKDEWPITATTVDAYYSPLANEIVLPAAILRKPMMYEPDVPLSLTYGAFGAIAGHEITHAFDHIGSMYNENGTLADWWSNVTRSTFSEKTRCFVEQYSQYTVRGPNGDISINGSYTLDESVADAGGVHGAYKAWESQQANRPVQNLPGLAMFSQKQLFWLSYGNWWCSTATPESLQQKILVDPYLPESIRVKVGVSFTLMHSANIYRELLQILASFVRRSIALSKIPLVSSGNTGPYALIDLNDSKLILGGAVDFPFYNA